MNEFEKMLAKLRGEADQHRQAMKSSLAAAEVEGCSAEDRKKHIAEFDAAESRLTECNASIDRVTRMQRAEQSASTHVRPAVAVAMNNPPSLSASGAMRVSSPRRNGPLRAFAGSAGGVDAEERAYRVGLWVAATQYGHAQSREAYEGNYGRIQATLSTSNNSGAAFLVDDVMDREIIRLTEQYGVTRRLANVRPMSSDTLTVPRWNQSLTAYFVGDGAAPTQSEQGYDSVGLVAKNLAAYGKMTRQLNEDAIINLGDEWTNAGAIAFAYAEDNAAFNGDGTSTYGGITGMFPKIAAANAIATVTATGHTTLASLTLTDFWNVVGRLPSYPGIQPAWLVHKEVYAASMGPLQTAAGGATPQDIANGGTPRFLGYPVEFVNVMPRAASVTTGVAGILFGDMGMSVTFGDRRQRTMETGMINDDLIKQLMTLFMSERIDVNCHTITDPKDATRAGPMLALKLG